MSKKFLSKAIAGAALGGASLLIGAPGIAVADGANQPDDRGSHNSDDRSHHRGDNGNGDHRGDNGDSEDDDFGRIFTKREWNKAGHKVKIIQICGERQDRPWAFSELFGKVDLKSKDHDRHNGGENGNGNHHGDNGNGNHRGDNGNGDHRGASPAASPTANPADPKNEKSPAPTASPTNKDEHHEKSEGENRDERGGDERGEHREHHKKWVYFATVKLPKHAKPGQYELEGSCASGELFVVPKDWVVPSDDDWDDNGYGKSGHKWYGKKTAGSDPATIIPIGSVDGGDGGSGTDAGMAFGGATMLGAAALGGVVLMKRRRTDETVA